MDARLDHVVAELAQNIGLDAAVRVVGGDEVGKHTVQVCSLVGHCGLRSLFGALTIGGLFSTFRLIRATLAQHDVDAPARMRHKMSVSHLASMV